MGRGTAHTALLMALSSSLRIQVEGVPIKSPLAFLSSAILVPPSPVILEESGPLLATSVDPLGSVADTFA